MPSPDRASSDRLDRLLPVFDVHEHHEVQVAASPEDTWRAAVSVDFRRSWIIRLVFQGREWLMGSHGTQRPPPRPFVEEARLLGWRPLVEEPGRLLVMGAVTQPWLPDVTFRGLTPEAFAAFDEPGFARIVWTLAVEPTGDGRSRCSTDTRVATTDADARRRFARYWKLISPGVRVIRRRILAMIRAEAERRSQR